MTKHISKTKRIHPQLNNLNIKTNTSISIGCPIKMQSLCPRCGSETLELDKPTIEIARKKKIRISQRQCPKCKLFFQEGT
jgi:ribosomal protein S27AE